MRCSDMLCFIILFDIPYDIMSYQIILYHTTTPKREILPFFLLLQLFVSDGECSRSYTHRCQQFHYVRAAVNLQRGREITEVRGVDVRDTKRGRERNKERERGVDVRDRKREREIE